MNCTCIEDVTKKLTEHCAGSGVVNPRVTAGFIGINLDTGEGVISMGFTVHGDNRPYNTQKGKPLNMVASYCPFCGKPTKKEPQNA